MVLHIYADDSDENASGKRKAYVIAGYIATPEAWAHFSEEWERLLEDLDVPRGPSGRRRFKMREIARRKMTDAKPFYETITKYAIGSISVVVYDDDLERAKARIWSDSVNLTFAPGDDGKNLVKKALIDALYKLMDDPSILAVEGGPSSRFSDMLKANRDRIEVYFDDDSASTWITDWWDYCIETYDPEIRSSEAPRYLDDEQYLPLQAADFWAWWSRRGYEDDSIRRFVNGDFGAWEGPKGPPALVMTFTEDQIVDFFIESFRNFVLFGVKPNIYDAKKKPKTEHAKEVFRDKSRAAMLQRFGLLLRRLRGR